MPVKGWSWQGATSGGGGGSSNSFATIQPDLGTAPVASSPTDTLTLTSAVLGVTGNSATDTITFTILNGVITNTMVSASAAIDYSKLAALTDGNILVGSAANVATSVSPSGDIDVSNTGVFSINSGVIVNADISGSAAIDFSKLAALSSTNILVGSAGNVATSVAVTGDVTISNTGVTAIGSGVIVNADVNASAAIDFSKLAALTSTNILVGNGSNVATAVAMSGDATLSSAGAITIGAQKVGVSKMTLAANTMPANNTGSTAAPTEVAFDHPDPATYSGTITWTGTTPPSGATTHEYVYEQTGKWATLTISLKYATAGTTLQGVAMTFPAGVPSPKELSGNTGGSDRLWPGSGWIETTASSAAGAARCYIRRNSGDTAYEMFIQAGSGNHAFAEGTVRYMVA